MVQMLNNPQMGGADPGMNDPWLQFGTNAIAGMQQHIGQRQQYLNVLKTEREKNVANMAQQIVKDKQLMPSDYPKAMQIAQQMYPEYNEPSNPWEWLTYQPTLKPVSGPMPELKSDEPFGKLYPNAAKSMQATLGVDLSELPLAPKDVLGALGRYLDAKEMAQSRVTSANISANKETLTPDQATAANFMSAAYAKGIGDDKIIPYMQSKGYKPDDIAAARSSLKQKISGTQKKTKALNLTPTK